MVKAVARERRRLGSPPPGGISPTDPNPFGWGPFVVLFVVGMVDRIEANLLSGVLPLVQAEWGFSDTAAGSIPTAAALAATLVALPAGYLADRYNRTRILGIVVLCWALATLGTGLAAGFAVFYLMRVLLAAAENIDNPAVSSLLADFYPGALTALLVWRLREPERGQIDKIMAAASVPRQDPAPPREAEAKLLFWPQLRQVLATRTLVLVSVGVSILTLGLGGVYYWLPSLMVRVLGMQTGVASSISGGVTIVGVLAGTLIGTHFGNGCTAASRAAGCSSAAPASPWARLSSASPC
ncbi:MFS transporter [Nonomuraea harbinensis]|uniref:MFS transporter n=1 Tax=Nonomuraea harbinensis TaxID=1286938 RepID=A0ABW1C7G7_9ACTN|nr:MFS transporter [Nonomuraea harbinensis]